jgi:type IX secretion system PorP/SprF family membrane protein
MFRKVSLLVLSLGLLGTVKAQDPHFSMYYAVPMSINPAFTGMFNGNIRATAQFRSQWGTVLGGDNSFRSTLGSIELKTNKAFGKTDAFSGGVYFMNDVAGQSKYTINRGALSFAYRFSFDKWGDHFLSVGFAPGFMTNGLDFTGLSFGSQWNGVAYDPNRPNGETPPDGVRFNYDMSAGLLWGLKNDRKRTRYHIGFSMLHINQPNQSLFFGSNAWEVKLPMKITTHIGATLPMSENLEIMPKALVMLQGNSHEEILGADFKILLEDRNSYGNAFYVGGLIRTVGGDSSSINAESFAVTARFDVGDWELGAAYDFNISSLNRASYFQGAFEVSLAYIGRFSKVRQRRMYCPKF